MCMSACACLACRYVCLPAAMKEEVDRDVQEGRVEMLHDHVKV